MSNDSVSSEQLDSKLDSSLRKKEANLLDQSTPPEPPEQAIPPRPVDPTQTRISLRRNQTFDMWVKENLTGAKELRTIQEIMEQVLAGKPVYLFSRFGWNSKGVRSKFHDACEYTIIAASGGAVTLLPCNRRGFPTGESINVTIDSLATAIASGRFVA